MRTPKRILITGGCGFIGSAMIRWLFDHLEETAVERVVNLDLLTYAGNPENLLSVSGSAHADRYELVRGDICEEGLVERLCRERGIDTIIHFAAESHVDRSIRGPGVFIQTNIIGTYRILEAVRALNADSVPVHLHHVSTDEVYGSLGAEGLFHETTAYSPNSPYAASKASSDHLVRAYEHTFQISGTVSNCSNNYGPYQFPEKLIPLMLLNMLRGKPLPVYGDGTNVRDWLFVDDHAEAIWAIVTRGERGRTYNVGGEAEWRNIDLLHRLIEIVAEETGKSADALRSLITYVKDRPGHDVRYAIDCNRIKAELGWTQRHDLAEGLRKTVRWYLANGAWLEGVESGTYRNWVEQNYEQRG